MISRPNVFRTNPWHAYDIGLKAAWLGLYPGVKAAFDSGCEGHDDLDTNLLKGDWNWDPHLSRYAMSGFSATKNISTSAKMNGTGAFATSVWFKTDWAVGGVRAILGFGSSGTGLVRVGVDNGTAFLYAGTEYCRSTSSGYNDGEWHHFAALKPSGGDVTDVQLYIDGVSVGVSTSGTTAINVGTTYGITVGTDPATTSLYYPDSISDPMVWQRLLSRDEIRDLADPDLVMLKGYLLDSEYKGIVPIITATAGSPWNTYAQQ